MAGDGYESSCRRRAQSNNVHNSRQSTSPEYRIQSFTERTVVVTRSQSTECDSSITRIGTTQINERENKFPSSFVGMIGCRDFYRISKETGEAAKNYSITTSRWDLGGDVRNADVGLQERAADQSLVIADISSNTLHMGTVTSLGQGEQAAASSQLPSPRTSFLEHLERPPPP
ncbi:uncharacterized protein LJ206_001275 [Theristicus caerulescens]